MTARQRNRGMSCLTVSAALAVLTILLTPAPIDGVAPDWWESANFYQVYPRSFQDSDGDGIGDLNGIAQRLPDLVDLGITAIWLSPIFQSPMVDFGYDCSDYTRIHHEYGTLDDFMRLAQQCQALGIKLILDFVPNHTSDQHDWFVRSALRDPVYTDFYVWHPGSLDATTGHRLPPSNWLSMFRGAAWSFHEGRGEWYLHQFVRQQPDLNYRNQAVVDAMKEVLRLWLQRGVSGFRIDAVKFLFETAPVDGHYADELPSGECSDPEDTCFLTHVHTQDLAETYDMIYQWRALVDDYAAQTDGVTRLIMTEAYTSLANAVKYYGSDDGTRPGAHVPFNFELITHLNNGSTALDAKRLINSWLDAMPAGARANWVLGNHDNSRVASRFGRGRADLFNILLQTLPGAAITYYGEELALTDNFLRWNQTIDPAGRNAGPLLYGQFSRDPFRVPMPWTADGPSAGFSSNAITWLPGHPDRAHDNVQRQRERPFSHWQTFRALTRLRRDSRTLREGSVELQANADVLVYARSLANSETVAVVLNLSERSQPVDVAAVFGWATDAQLEVLTASVDSMYVAGDLVEARDVWAYGNVGVVFVLL